MAKEKHALSISVTKKKRRSRGAGKVTVVHGICSCKQFEIERDTKWQVLDEHDFHVAIETDIKHYNQALVKRERLDVFA